MIIDLLATKVEKDIVKHKELVEAFKFIENVSITPRRFKLVDMAHSKEPMTEKRWDEFHALARIPTPPYPAKKFKDSIKEQLQHEEDQDIFAALQKAADQVVAGKEILVPTFDLPAASRPVSSEDLKDIQEQLAATANDPNITIVSHEWFELCPNKNGNLYTSKDVNAVKSDMYLEHKNACCICGEVGCKHTQPNLGGDIFNPVITIISMLDEILATIINACSK